MMWGYSELRKVVLSRSQMTSRCSRTRAADQYSSNRSAMHIRLLFANQLRSPCCNAYILSGNPQAISLSCQILVEAVRGIRRLGVVVIIVFVVGIIFGLEW